MEQILNIKNFTGASGLISFDSNGDRLGYVIIYGVLAYPPSFKLALGKAAICPSQSLCVCDK